MTTYEVDARERKAAKIADHIWSCFQFAVGNTNPTHAQVSALVIEIAASGEAVRAAFARGAGAKPASSRTWLRVIELVSRRGMRACREAVMSGNGINGRMETMIAVMDAATKARAAEPTHTDALDIDMTGNGTADDPFKGLTEADDAVLAGLQAELDALV